MLTKENYIIQLKNLNLEFFISDYFFDLNTEDNRLAIIMEIMYRIKEKLNIEDKDLTCEDITTNQNIDLNQINLLLYIMNNKINILIYNFKIMFL